MKITLIGHGAMGQLIATLAAKKGHTIESVIDETDAAASASELGAKLSGVDVVIDFTSAEAVPRNVEACMIAGVPLVEGTTGWNAKRNDIEKIVLDADGAFVYGANFSIGVNLFYRVVDFASA